jgi:hypothetical protein
VEADPGIRVSGGSGELGGLAHSRVNVR